MTVHYSDQSSKIDGLAVDGLSGTSNSLAYKVHEIERHFHSYERWFCAAKSATATHKADDMITAATAVAACAAFQLDAGNDTWGSWVQLLGSEDTPVISGSTHFDLHQITVTAAERDTAVYVVQIGFGATGAAALSADTYSDVLFAPDDSNLGGNNNPIFVQHRRQTCGTLCWARCWCPGQNTGTLDFYIGVHEYEG